jgi:thiamine-phosphate pyrophosphorylase
MLRYAISNGLYGMHAGSRTGTDARTALLTQARHLASKGVDFFQLREKNLPAGDLADLAREILTIFRQQNAPTRLLLNTRADVALATAAHGVHLTSSPDALTPTQIRTLYRELNLPAPTISKACHMLDEVNQARVQDPDLILFSPVFGKPGARATGLDPLRQACVLARPVPVLALGGVTRENASACLRAGAHGIAAIRLFQPINP